MPETEVSEIPIGNFRRIELTWVVLGSEHCEGFAGSGGAVHKHRAIVAAHDGRDDRFGANLEDVGIFLFLVEDRVKLHVELLLDPLCDVAMSLLGTVEEELILVLVGIEDERRCVQNPDNIFLILFLKIQKRFLL